MKVQNAYTSVACNRTPQSADWGRNGLVVFAACNAVALFDPKYNGSAKITHTYVQHKRRINTVKWIPLGPGVPDSRFISGSDDSLAIVWDIEDKENPKIIKLEGHESGVNVVEANFINGRLTAATASTDSTIKIWKYNDEHKFDCIQTILLNNGFCLALALTTFPKSNQILLSYAGDDDTISILTETISDSNSQERKFIKIHDLHGHEDWVRCIDYIKTPEDDLLLATSSQDNFIRLWRISPRSEEQFQQNKIDVLNIPEGDIHVEEKILNISDIENSSKLRYAVSLESVLHGHEGWVYAVHWNLSDAGLQLLSSSIDKTLIIWSCTEDGIWMEKVRVGEVGGNSLGFFGGKFAHDGKAILGHGYQGSFHIWSQSEEDENIWKPEVIVGGHFADVRDISWEPRGQYLFSVSSDQTTRIHAPWIRKNSKDITWHEIARPQVHGYDLQCIAVLSRYKFASGAEEKIVRTFQATGNFIENFRRICNVTSDEEGDKILESIPKGASVPSLGLSNKAVFNCNEDNSQDKHVKDEYPENYFVPVTLTSPPQEETLMQNTLWPEVQKLYGHGFEIFALCASSDGKVLASSCKATNVEHAQIILWNTLTWKQIQKLHSHQLTVTQMKFSPDFKYLLSVSRDRRWTIFENKSQSELSNFELTATTDKKNGVHGRIIWSCDWSHDSQIFATSSRDGKVVIWGHGDNVENSSLGKWKALQVLEIKSESITAVAFAPKYLNQQELNYLIAIGFESGAIELYSFKSVFEKLLEIHHYYAHHSTVKKLQFRPYYDGLQLASCGEDNFVKIHEILL